MPSIDVVLIDTAKLFVAIQKMNKIIHFINRYKDKPNQSIAEEKIYKIAIHYLFMVLYLTIYC